MRKLFSAATSLVMAATMVSAVAPVVAGAADAKKGVSLLAYKDATLPDGVTSEGAVVNVTADAIAAGDVTIPVGVYFTEETADLKAASVQVTVNSDDGDAKSVKFEAVQPSDNFFAEDHSFTLADGTEFKTKKVVAFAGSYAKRGGYTAHGVYQLAATEKQDSAKTENAYFGMSWTNGAKAYKWCGTKSDDFPITVFKVNLPKGLKEGTYTLDYCNYITAYNNPSCLLETVSKYDAINNNNLDLNTLTIKVGASSSTSSTTTTGTTTTTTATASGSATTTTTATTKPNGGEVTGDFIVHFDNPEDENGYWHANAGETVDVDMYVTSPSNKKPTGFDFKLSVEGDITLAEIFQQSPAFAGTTIVSSLGSMTFNGTCAGSDGHGIELVQDEAAAYLTFNVPAGTPDGLYAINVIKADITDDSKPSPLSYKVGTKVGYIQVGDAVTTATTTSSATTTTTTTTATASGSATSTSKSTSSTTTTTATSKPGTKLYGDTNCDGVVKINDVVLLNKYLNDNKSYAITEQGKINADCYNPKDGKELTAEDSDAIIKSIVHLVELPVQQ